MFCCILLEREVEGENFFTYKNDFAVVKRVLYRIAVCFNIRGPYIRDLNPPPPPSGSFDLSLLFDLIYPAMPPLSC
jgi:hypothetical protein